MGELTRRGLFGLMAGAAALPVVGKPAAEIWSDGLPEGYFICASSVYRMIEQEVCGGREPNFYGRSLAELLDE